MWLQIADYEGLYVYVHTCMGTKDVDLDQLHLHLTPLILVKISHQRIYVRR